MVDHYVDAMEFEFTEHEKQDLVNFLSALQPEKNRPLRGPACRGLGAARSSLGVAWYAPTAQRMASGFLTLHDMVPPASPGDFTSVSRPRPSSGMPIAGPPSVNKEGAPGLCRRSSLLNATRGEQYPYMTSVVARIPFN